MATRKLDEEFERGGGSDRGQLDWAEGRENGRALWTVRKKKGLKG